MNTRKQVLAMSALLMMVLIIVGIYGAWYPSRETDARVDFDEHTAERGSIIFARNCRLCHGDVGEGGAAGARLAAAPALDRADLQGFTDVKVTLIRDVKPADLQIQVNNVTPFKGGQTILVEDERMLVKGTDGTFLNVVRPVAPSVATAHLSGAAVLLQDAAVLKDKAKYITNTITCGHVGTDMLAWAQTQGGPLSDEQIRQLTLLITQDRWDLVKEEVDREDLLDAHLMEPMDEITISMHVDNVAVFTTDDVIRMSDERIRITAVPTTTTENGKTVKIADAKDKGGLINVQRGVLNSAPLPHSTDEEIHKFPVAPTEPAINQASCGQTAQAPVPAGTPGTIEPFSGATIILIAQNIAFDKKDITAKTGGQIRLRLDNRDVGVKHNVAIYKSATELTPASPGSVGVQFEGAGIDDTVFDAPAPGSYYFRCDVHPTTMTGTFEVTN